MVVDPRRLTYLLAVARCGGVNAAADELHMTPSAVSQQIARLERETGARLLNRKPQGSTLTPAGLLLAEAAQQIERTLADVTAQIASGETELRGVIRIGSFQSFISVAIAPNLRRWREALPGVHFEVIEGEREPLLRALTAGEVDIAIVEFDTGEPQKALPKRMTEVPLLDEPWKLVGPAGTLLSDVLDLRRVGLPWLGADTEAAAAQAIDRLNRMSGTGHPTVHRCQAVQTTLALAAAGEGIAVLPMLALHGQPAEGLDIIDVPGLGTRRIVLRSYSRTGSPDGLVTSVTGLIREAAARISAELRPTG
ncbi:LysR family transcriptional regulator [uncultured Mycolicibacterium sp.]|uniref:LysR family transcriptional regulator n=1 Tax=uncultured Mycolicibacterium sp. TaxID=2320817 RepID=UPI00260A7FDA|nr:LysR family transcriptional regulator [uncultured Mycolicibacterium sp.]